MISVVVPTLNAEHSLVACLAPLVPASMAGLVRELIVVDAGSTDATLEIADDAGAHIVRSADGVGAGIAAAKGPWILALAPGVRLERGWETEVQRHIEGSREAARFRLYRADGGWLAGLIPPQATAALFLKEAGDRRGGGLDANALRRLGGRRLDVRAAV
jgi:glycosyltransferase involved in cell wall biosynthesis